MRSSAGRTIVVARSEWARRASASVVKWIARERMGNILKSASEAAMMVANESGVDWGTAITTETT